MWDAPAGWRTDARETGVAWLPEGARMSTTLTPGPARRFGRGPDADAALVGNAAAGDDHAFEAFYHRHADGLLGYCRHLLGSRHEAEDAVQQTFFSAYREIAGGRLPDKPKPWLYAIARNRSMSTIRARREQPSDLVERESPELTEVVGGRADLRQLVLDLHRLPEDQRSAIVLFELAGLAQADIGEVLGREPDQVRALVYQARSTLMAGRTAREIDCERVQAQLSVARGGQLNSRTLRRHVDGCEDCKAYLEEVRRQRRGLPITLPFAPVLVASGSAATSGTTAGATVGVGRQIGRLRHLAKPAAA